MIAALRNDVETLKQQLTSAQNDLTLERLNHQQQQLSALNNVRE